MKKKTTTQKTETVNEELDMTKKEFDKALIELEKTIYWQVIKKYNYQRLVTADNGLRSIDPFKSPTEIARIQGMISGLYDLENYVKALIAKESEKNTESEILTY